MTRLAVCAEAGAVGLLNVRRVGQATIEPFDAAGPSFKDAEIACVLTRRNEDVPFESLLMQGLIDE